MSGVCFGFLRVSAEIVTQLEVVFPEVAIHLNDVEICVHSRRMLPRCSLSVEKPTGEASFSEKIITEWSKIKRMDADRFVGRNSHQHIDDRLGGNSIHSGATHMFYCGDSVTQNCHKLPFLFKSLSPFIREWHDGDQFIECVASAIGIPHSLSAESRNVLMKRGDERTGEMQVEQFIRLINRLDYCPARKPLWLKSPILNQERCRTDDTEIAVFVEFAVLNCTRDETYRRIVNHIAKSSQGCEVATTWRGRQIQLHEVRKPLRGSRSADTLKKASVSC